MTTLVGKVCTAKHCYYKQIFINKLNIKMKI